MHKLEVNTSKGLYIFYFERSPIVIDSRLLNLDDEEDLTFALGFKTKEVGVEVSNWNSNYCENL